MQGESTELVSILQTESRCMRSFDILHTVV